VIGRSGQLQVRPHAQAQSKVVSRKLVIWLSIPFILVGLAVGCWFVVRYQCERERTDWKRAALSRLAELPLDNEEIGQELDTLKANRRAGKYPEWTGEHVLLMTNDEYLIYASRHGFNNGLVDHLFLARGSDGRWFYSTYHFCNSMVGVIVDSPPSSIAEFAKRYSVREFDGKSDVCLQHTWPPDD
jgi:hypothetical protein